MRAKYIVVSYMETENAIIFPEVLGHSDIACGRKVLGAGFVQFGPSAEGDSVISYCFGESVTLNVKSRGHEDEALINRYILNDY